MSFFARPFIPMLVAMMSGIGIGAYLRPGISWISAATVVVAIVLIRKIYHRQTAILCPIIFFFCIGLLSIVPFTSPTFPFNHIIHYTDTDRFTIKGRLATTPVKKNGRWRFILKTEFLQKSHSQNAVPVCGNIRVTARTLESVPGKGDRISFCSRIRSIRNFHNPGRFNYERYMAFKNIWGTAYIWRNHVRIIQKNENICIFDRWKNTNEKFRLQIAALINTLSLSPETRAILQAILIGKRDLISSSLRDVFNRSGVGHLLAISGLHIGMVTTSVFVLSSYLFSLFTPLLWNAWMQRSAALFALLPIWSYGWLAGFTPSTQRAEIMITLWLLSFLVQREKDAINCLAIAAFIILITFPPALFSISFQLSFAAVLSILLGTSLISFPSTHNAGWMKKLVKFIAISCLVSGLAIMGTLPLTMLYFHQVSLIGVAANLLIVPLVGAFVLPMGLFAVVIFPCCTKAAVMAMQLSGFAMEGVLRMIYFFADFRWAALNTFVPTAVEVSGYYVLWGVVIALLKTRPVEEPITVRLKKSHCPIVFIGISLVIGADAVYWLNHRFWHNDLRATVVDVGQGNAALIEFPGGKTMLIDGGGFSDCSVFDVGKNILAPFLRQKKILTVDTIVLTHPDCDHLNGLLYIMQHFHVQSVWTNHQDVDSIGYRKFVKIIKEEGIAWPRYSDVKRHLSLGKVSLQILYPSVDYFDKMKYQKWRNTNNNSMILKVSLKDVSILFPGDIMKSAERELALTVGDALKSDVLIAPHHGSKSSSTALFLKKVDPKVVIISCGWLNRFHFPHASVLNRYRQNGCQYFRTDTDGAVMLSTNGHHLNLRSFCDGK